MAKAFKDRGRRSFWGIDKGIKALNEFDDRLASLLSAMLLDQVVQKNDSSEKVCDELLGLIGFFSQAFPNWPDAYSFAEEYFVKGREAAVVRIDHILRA